MARRSANSFDNIIHSYQSDSDDPLDSIRHLSSSPDPLLESNDTVYIKTPVRPPPPSIKRASASSSRRRAMGESSTKRSVAPKASGSSKRRRTVKQESEEEEEEEMVEVKDEADGSPKPIAKAGRGKTRISPAVPVFTPFPINDRPSQMEEKPVLLSPARRRAVRRVVPDSPEEEEETVEIGEAEDERGIERDEREAGGSLSGTSRKNGRFSPVRRQPSSAPSTSPHPATVDESRPLTPPLPAAGLSSIWRQEEVEEEVEEELEGQYDGGPEEYAMSSRPATPPLPANFSADAAKAKMVILPTLETGGTALEGVAEQAASSPPSTPPLLHEQSAEAEEEKEDPVALDGEDAPAGEVAEAIPDANEAESPKDDNASAEAPDEMAATGAQHDLAKEEASMEEALAKAKEATADIIPAGSAVDDVATLRDGGQEQEVVEDEADEEEEPSPLHPAKDDDVERPGTEVVEDAATSVPAAASVAADESSDDHIISADAEPSIGNTEPGPDQAEGDIEMEGAAIEAEDVVPGHPDADAAAGDGMAQNTAAGDPVPDGDQPASHTTQEESAVEHGETPSLAPAATAEALLATTSAINTGSSVDVAEQSAVPIPLTTASTPLSSAPSRPVLPSTPDQLSVPSRHIALHSSSSLSTAPDVPTPAGPADEDVDMPFTALAAVVASSPTPHPAEVEGEEELDPEDREMEEEQEPEDTIEAAEAVSGADSRDVSTVASASTPAAAPAVSGEVVVLNSKGLPKQKPGRKKGWKADAQTVIKDAAVKKGGKAAVGKKGKVEALKSAARGRSDSTSSISETPAPSKSTAGSRSNVVVESVTETDSDEGEEDFAIYCTCGKLHRSDGNDELVGCDGCDGWFHAGCVGLTKSEIDLIANFYCPSCEKATANKTVLKRLCKRDGCEKKFTAKQSKFCSSHCGFRHAHAIVADMQSKKQHKQLKQLSTTLAHYPPPPPDVKIVEHTSSTTMTSHSPSDPIDILEKSIASTEAAISILEKRLVILAKAVEQCDTVPPLTAPGDEAGKKKRKVGGGDDRPCAWVEALIWGDEAVDAWEVGKPLGVIAAPAEGEDVEMAEGAEREEDVGAYCLNQRKRCDRHAGWQKTVPNSLDVELAQAQESLLNLTSERDHLTATREHKEVGKIAREHLHEVLALNMAKKFV